eukprot:jgi/Botrbrau1/21317/Bobra.0184s0028.1
MSYFYQPLDKPSYSYNRCYMKEDMVSALQSQVNLRSNVTGVDGHLSTPHRHACVDNVKSMNPLAWKKHANETLEEFRRKVESVLSLTREWELRDIIILKQGNSSTAGPGYNYENSTWVLRFQNVLKRQRYDYVIMLGFDPDGPDAPEAFNDGPFAWKLNEAAQAMRESFFSKSDRDYAFMYQAFVESWNASGLSESNMQQCGPGTPASVLQRYGMPKQVQDCLLSNTSDIRISDRNADSSAMYRCSHYIDVEMWESWSSEYEVEKSIFMKGSIWLGLNPVDYDTYNAIWTGLVGAVLNSIFVVFGLILYFAYSVFQAARDSKHEHSGDGVNEEVGWADHDHDHDHDTDAQDAMLLRSEAGMTRGSHGRPVDPTGSPSIAAGQPVSRSLNENAYLGRTSASNTGAGLAPKLAANLPIFKQEKNFASPLIRRASSSQAIGFRGKGL